MPVIFKDLLLGIVLVCLLLAFTSLTQAADSVPAVSQQPGTQPGVASNLESPDKGDNCHPTVRYTARQAAGPIRPAAGTRGTVSA